MTAVLRTRGLSVRYGGNVAVHPIDLEVPAGALVAVVGSNGAGKSSLLGAVAGWSRGAAVVGGEVELAGARISRLAAYRRARTGLTLVPENHAVFYELTTEENLKLAGARRPGTDRRTFSIDDVYQIFPRLRERSHHKASALSGGERQMLAIGRGLRAAPQLLLLDEPSIGLAPMLVGELLSAVRRLVDEGLTVLLAEQNVVAVLNLADHLLLLERGRVVAQGPPDEMRDDQRLIDAYLGSVAR